MKISKEKRDEIEKYLSKDLETLLSSLASPELVETIGFRYIPGKELEQGIKIFKSLKKKLYQQVCVEWEYCKKRNDSEYNDTVNLVAALIDIIASLTIGIPPALIATILVKKGLSEFCSCSS